MSAFVLGVATAVPAAGADGQAFVEAESSLGLVGTGAAFLLIGLGSLKIAHRRRWGTVDLRGADGDADSLAPSRGDRA